MDVNISETNDPRNGRYDSAGKVVNGRGKMKTKKGPQVSTTRLCIQSFLPCRDYLQFNHRSDRLQVITHRGVRSRRDLN